MIWGENPTIFGNTQLVRHVLVSYVSTSHRPTVVNGTPQRPVPAPVPYGVPVYGGGDFCAIFAGQIIVTPKKRGKFGGWKVREIPLLFPKKNQVGELL